MLGKHKNARAEGQFSPRKFLYLIFSSMNNFFRNVAIGVVVFIIALIFVPILLGSGVGTIQTGERGVLLRFGSVHSILNEGLYFKIPFIDSVEIVDIRIQKEQTEADSASKDLQTVNAIVALNFHVDERKVGNIYSSIGTDFKAKLVDPAIQESVKAATAKYTAEELVTKRESVRADITALLKTKLQDTYGLIVNDVNIVNFKFSEAFEQAIE